VAAFRPEQIENHAPLAAEPHPERTAALKHTLKVGGLSTWGMFGCGAQYHRTGFDNNTLRRVVDLAQARSLLIRVTSCRRPSPMA
jgi:hypothetical protein